MEAIMILYFFLIGLALGSFTNVLIFRLPASISIVFPPSACPKCSARIKWYDNIPLLSWIILRGRCRSCSTAISPEYPIVETISGVIAVLLYLKYGIKGETFIHLLLLPVFLSIVLIDFKTMFIHDSELIASAAIAIVYFILVWIRGNAIPLKNIYSALILLGIFFLIYFLGKIIYKKEAFGSGDVLLAPVIGIFLPMEHLFTYMIVATVSAAIYGVTVRILHKKESVPFGPFMIGAFYLVIFMGTELAKMFIPLDKY